MINGVVDLTVSPGFDDARVTVVVDGQKLAEGLRSPYHVTVDFGPTVVEHKISVIAYSGDTGPTEALWQAARGVHGLGAIILECAFPNRLEGLAKIARHMTPELIRRSSGGDTVTVPSSSIS